MDKKKAEVSNELRELIKSKYTRPTYSNNAVSTNHVKQIKRSSSNDSKSKENITEIERNKYKINNLNYNSPKKSLIKSKKKEMFSEEEGIEDDSIQKELKQYKKHLGLDSSRIKKSVNEPNESKNINLLDKLKSKVNN